MYADRDELRKAVANAGGVEQAHVKGLLPPDGMPDDEMRMCAADLEKSLWLPLVRNSIGETPPDEAYSVFAAAMNAERCDLRDYGSRLFMGGRESDE